MGLHVGRHKRGMDMIGVSLIEALKELPEHVFTRVKETVDGEQPILIGRWLAQVEGEEFGCLMCDGLTVCEPAIVKRMMPDTNLMKYGYGPHMPVLMKFYDVEDWTPIEDVARSFDEWAFTNQYVDDSRTDTSDRIIEIINTEGRIVLREIFDHVEEMAAHA